MSQNAQTVKAVVTKIDVNTYSKKDGSGTTTKYTIVTNEGKQYFTWDKEYVDTLTLGEETEITYIVRTNTYRGRTTYQSWIAKPEEAQAAAPAVSEGKILRRLDLMENNILSAIQLALGEPKIPEDVDPGYIPEATKKKEETSTPAATTDTPASEDEPEELNPEDIPY